MLPSIKINAGIGYSNLGAGMIGSAVGNLVAPIFNWGKLRANVTRAKSYKEEILINYQKTIYTAISEVSNGILNVDKQNTVVKESKNLQLLPKLHLICQTSCSMQGMPRISMY